nr:MAG TPA: hypothetical protein [Caudoviricetes sp.]DAW38863.1 MAG TPA: hypothetical protein [Caudoviricetes sp.]
MGSRLLFFCARKTLCILKTYERNHQCYTSPSL